MLAKNVDLMKMPPLKTNNNFKDKLLIHKNVFTFSKQGIHVASLNIQHILPKLDELKLIMGEPGSIDIFGLSETFLTGSINDTDLLINDFVFERKDRSKKAGGGLIIYLKKNISYVRRFDLESSDIETIWLQVAIENNKSHLLCFIYRAPNSPQSWIDSFEKQMEFAESSNMNWSAIGDFNIEFTSPNTFNNTKWANTVLDFGLTQLVQYPTRVTKTSSK